MHRNQEKRGKERNGEKTHFFIRGRVGIGVEGRKRVKLGCPTYRSKFTRSCCWQSFLSTIVVVVVVVDDVVDDDDDALDDVGVDVARICWRK